MADEYFAGLRATGDLATDERPESWRAGVLRLFPNGKAPLTGLTSLMKSEKVPDPHYHWWTKTLTTQRAAITAISTDSTLASAYTGAAGVAEDAIYLTMSAAASTMFRAGHVVMVRDADDYNVDSVGKVTTVVSNGSSSYVALRMLEDDANTVTAHTWADVDTALIIGNMNPQGGTRPEAITQSPTELENYTQIWRNSLDLARTLMETKLRTSDAYKEAKRDALEQHSIEIEKSLLWSALYSAGTGSNGKPEYATRGLVSWVVEHVTVQDYTLDTAATFAGKLWLQAGEDWIDEHLEEILRYGGTERLALIGSGALLGIQRLVKDVGMYNLTAKTALYGSNVLEWVTPFGKITFMTHPLFSYEATNRNTAILIEPKNLRWRYVTDTKFMPDTAYGKGGGTGYDGKQEEFLTEGGLEIHYPETTGYLNGVGLLNTQ